jgi:flagellar P-ring protein precursor FlgI
MKQILLLTLTLWPLLALAQAPAASDKSQDIPRLHRETAPLLSQTDLDRRSILKAEQDGVEVRIKDLGHFRGIRFNQLIGLGLVTGLEGTGDTIKSPVTIALLTNYYTAMGAKFDATQIDPKNVALVNVTCDLPPFAKPGTQVDVVVSAMGDAKSLQGGTLIRTPLYGASSERAYVVAEGPLSIGGFNISAGGAASQRNHTNVGRIPGGGIVEAPVATKFVFAGGKMYLDLDQEDLTTAHRAAERIAKEIPTLLPIATDGSTIELHIADGADPVTIMSQVESIRVNADVEADVVINERTGTIVVGGNVALAPCAVAQGSLQVRIQQDNQVIQPLPLSNGNTQTQTNTAVDVSQETAKVALIPPRTTVADLARILQTLRLKPTDIISILQALRQQGALKARVVLQ